MSCFFSPILNPVPEVPVPSVEVVASDGRKRRMKKAGNLEYWKKILGYYFTIEAIKEIWQLTLNKNLLLVKLPVLELPDIMVVPENSPVVPKMPKKKKVGGKEIKQQSILSPINLGSINVALKHWKPSHVDTVSVENGKWSPSYHFIFQARMLDRLLLEYPFTEARGE